MNQHRFPIKNSLSLLTLNPDISISEVVLFRMAFDQILKPFNGLGCTSFRDVNIFLLDSFIVLFTKILAVLT